MLSSPTESLTNDAQTASVQTTRNLLLLLILFAGSGCSALIYEIVWYQLLQFSIGSTAVSLAILLATFMGGLCLGSLALPRIRALRRHHPLRVYAVMEAAIAFCAIVVLFEVPLVSHVYLGIAGHGLGAVLLRAFVCSICLLPPTALMGASLPAVSRWLESTPRGISWFGLLYGANTTGAVFGCLLAGFYLLRVFDMRTATFVAVAINVAVALISFGLATFASAPVQETAPQRAPAWARPAVRPRRIYLAIALSGASALGAEVIWTRLLGIMMGATVYTYSIILAVFLIGLGIGSGAGSLLSRTTDPRKALGYCQLLLTAAIAWTAFMIAKSLPYWPINPKLSGPWFVFQVDLARVLWAVLPPTLLWGASFPLALAAAASREDDPAQLTGAVYAANTAGAILGALLFSMLLIPWIGTHQSERVLIGLSLVSALILLLPLARSAGTNVPVAVRAKEDAFWLAISAVLAGLLAWTVPAVPGSVVAYGRLFQSLASNSRILYVGEGLNSTIAISQWGKTLQFHVSGKVEASAGPYDMRVQRMLGHLPALLQAEPRSALVVGFGAGVTAGSLVTYPQMQRIVVCEIEPLIPPVTSRYFAKENYDVLHDPRTQIVYDDARHFILATHEKFDVITSDPIHPWVKGSAALYTKEYFQLVRDHLNPGGLVAQWVPLYESDENTVKSEIATFFDVFPNGSIWANEIEGGGYDVMLLGQTGPAQAASAQAGPVMIDISEIQKRLDRPDYAGVTASLRDVGLGSAMDMLSTYAGQAPDLTEWLKGAAINRDGNLRLQYLAGWAVDTNREGPIYDTMLRYRRFPANLIVGPADQVRELQSKFAPTLATD